jgi:hypothetical protein
MTSQERITQLAQAALRAAPPSGRLPKPATYMPSFEQMRSERFIERRPAASAPGKVQAAAPKPAPAPAPVAITRPVVKDAVDSDKNLTAMLDRRDEVKERKLRRTSLAVTCTLLALCTGFGAFATFHPAARRQMGSLAGAIRESGKDLKALGSIIGTYGKQLDKVAVQGSRVDAATMALGVNPDTDTSGQDVLIAAAMEDFSGSEAGGPTLTERDATLKAKFGLVGKLAGGMAPQTRKAVSDVQF